EAVCPAGRDVRLVNELVPRPAAHRLGDAARKLPLGTAIAEPLVRRDALRGVVGLVHLPRTVRERAVRRVLAAVRLVRRSVEQPGNARTVRDELRDGQLRLGRAPRVTDV